jgi:hypothetical protein
MLQLYGELVNVRGDYADCSGIGPPDFSGRKNGGGDAQEGDNGGGNLHQQRHSSDPDLAAIPYRVSTLDRRISMKLTRARSLDLSSWSLGSRTSSWTTSSSSGMHTHLRTHRVRILLGTFMRIQILILLAGMHAHLQQLDV